MKAVIQRVRRARVSTEEGTVGEITRPGLFVLLGITHDDAEAQVEKISRKIAELRLMESEKSVSDIDAPVLVVSQFTLYADVRKGRRPSWNGAAGREVAEPLVEQVCHALEERGLEVARGAFGEHMVIETECDGPVTIVLEA